MKNFNKETFKTLAEIHAPHCISIYIPTHRINENGESAYLDKTTLKNELKEVSEQLSLFKLSDNEIDERLKPLENLMKNPKFWNHLSDGLAIFSTEKELKTYTVPISFTANSYINSHFNLKPMANLLRDTKQCLILALSLNNVALYQVNSTEVFEFEVADLIPNKMTDAVGEDYEEKHLEGRINSPRIGGDYDAYHGHGRSNDNIKKEEALRYFQQISNGLETFLNTRKLPLVVACVDYLFPIFEEANNYQFLVTEHIGGNPEHTPIEDLADQAMVIISKENEAILKTTIEKFNENLNNGKSSYKYENIIPAAVGGKVETLFLNLKHDIWGKYNPEDHSIETNKIRHTSDSDLMNLAVVETIKNGGEVMVLNEKDMPTVASNIAAVYRY